MRWVAFLRWYGLLVQDGPEPALVVQTGEVWDANRAAREQGVHHGQTLATARSLCPGVRHADLDPVRADARLYQAADLVALACRTVDPDGLRRPQIVALWTGTVPPLPELRSLREAASSILPHVDLACGLGPNRLLAEACCPERGWGVVAHGEEARWLAPLPLTRLVAMGLLPQALLRSLAGMGLQRCGQVAELPVETLRSRLGRLGKRAHALCLGQDERPVPARYPPTVVREGQAFCEGLPPADWAQAAADLARRAARRLPWGEGVGTMVLRGPWGTLQRTWNPPQRGEGLLARAAARLAQEATRMTATPAERVEVCLTELAALPAHPLELLPRPVMRERPDLEAVLERVPQTLLRRGWGRADRYETLLGMLDPWRESR